MQSIKSAPFFKSLNFIKVKNFLRPLIVVTILSSQLAFQGIAGAATTSTLTTTELNSPSLDWRSIAISSDGTKIVAASTGAIYVSSDSGTTWTSKYSGPNFNSVAISGDGNKIVATNRGNQNSYIYTSTNFGTSWTTSRPSGYECWNSCKIEMSTDGTRIYLTNYDNGIYVSSDSGVNWTRSSTTAYFNTFSASSDGQYAVAAQDGGYIYKSTDYGSTWNQITNAGNKNWVSITVADDGQKIAASAWENYVYTSDNGGTTWTTRTEISGQKIYLSSTADGNTIVAGKYNGYLSISGDGGANWNTEPVNRGWNNSAVTSDGLTAFLTIGEATGKLRSISISPSSTTPSAPTSLSATAGDGQATISFTPGSDGGSSITNYKYSTDGTTYTALSPTDSSSPVTIPGLTNRTSYTIYLKAVNANGDSAASSSVTVTPSTTPSAPTSLSATAGDGQATISFTSGSDGGSTISNYKYSTDGTNYTDLSPTNSSSPITIPGLTNGTSYTIYLKAVNANGDSSASSSVSVTPVAPAVPTGDSSGPDNYFVPIRNVEVSNGRINWEPNRKVVISKYDSSSKKATIIESVNGKLVLPKAKPGQSISYSIMATDGTVLKVVTMKTKPNAPKLARVASQKSEILTKNKKMAITAQWKKDKSVKKYIVKITLENGKSITASTTDPNFSIITDETKGATITITAVGKNNLTSTVTRKI